MLTLDPIVKVNLLVGSATSASNVFDVGLILGSSDTISSTDRVKEYASLLEMTSDGFETTDEEYLAAAKYFAASPAPASVMIASIASGETPVQALTAVLEKTNHFYGVYLCGGDATKILALDEFLTGLGHHMQFYGVKATAAEAASASGTFAQLKARDSRRAIGLTCKTDENDAAALMGTAMGLSHMHTSDAFALCYKKVPGAETFTMTQSEVDNIKKVNGNVYIIRGYGHAMVEPGTTASGLRFDEVMYLDMLSSDMQDACIALIADRSSKLPQTDTASALIMSALTTTLQNYVNRGVIAAGTWRGDAVGSLSTGDALDSGYMLYADSYDNQTAADREAHKAMPITCCLCLAGSVESVELNVYVQR
ncbi:MAG: DUF3383 family protein [Clostridia bacterium]|nr:DUF3383 family protein [Clostridia bacterium]